MGIAEATHILRDIAKALTFIGTSIGTPVTGTETPTISAPASVSRCWCSTGNRAGALA